MNTVARNLVLALTVALSAFATAGDDKAKGNKAVLRSVVGEIVDTRDIALAEVDARHKLVKLETPKGKRVVVDLGDATKLQGADYQTGDRIFAVGKAARIGGKPVIFARYAGQVEPVGATGQQ